MKTHLLFDLLNDTDEGYTLVWEQKPLLRFEGTGHRAYLGQQAASLFAVTDLLRWGAPLALGPQGMVLIHAAAAALTETCVAFLGVGGAGKSTLADVLGQEGWHRISDDILLCGPGGRINVLGEGTVRRWCQATSLRLDVSGVVPYADLGDRLRQPSNQRWRGLDGLLYLLQGRTMTEACELTPLPPMENFKLLVRYGFGGLPTPQAWRHQFEVYADVARCCPAAVLRVPQGLERLRRSVSSLEGQIRSWLESLHD